MIEIFTTIPKPKEMTPDDRAAAGMRPRAPLCFRCNREATQQNPVRAHVRESWHPFGGYRYETLDGVCAECLYGLTGRT